MCSSESATSPLLSYLVVTLPRRRAACVCCQSEHSLSPSTSTVIDMSQYHRYRRCVAPPRCVVLHPFLPCTHTSLILLDYKFDLMYSKRAFVHWYVGEGMEEVCAVKHTHRCASC